MPDRTTISRLSVWLWACISIACQPQLAEPAPVIEPALIYSAVVGGKEVSECQFPSTVSIGNGCTGTLIHPRVVTTAAHCLNGDSSTIRFGGARDGGGSFTLMGRCESGARSGGRGGGGGGNRDWGYCVLPEDDRVKKLHYTPPLVGCERDKYLKQGASGWVVGYGTTGPDGRGAGVKRAVEVKINRVSDGIVNIGDRNVGACHGDSGGPIYMQLSDGANDYGLRVFGSTSGAGDAFCDCTCSTNYVDIDMHVKAIEENEDIDVTPCTDAEGNWAPGPECNAIQTQPMMGSGTFPGCTTMRTTAPINSCSASAAPAAGSGGGSATAAAGSGAKPNGAAGAGGSTTMASAAGATAAPAAGGGATPPVTTGSSTSNTPRMSGASGATGVTSMSTSPAASAGAGGSRTATGATGTSTEGVSAAGGPANTVATGAVAASPPSPVDSGGCGVANAPRHGETSSALLCALSMLWLTTRQRRRRS